MVTHTANIGESNLKLVIFSPTTTITNPKIYAKGMKRAAHIILSPHPELTSPEQCIVTSSTGEAITAHSGARVCPQSHSAGW